MTFFVYILEVHGVLYAYTTEDLMLHSSVTQFLKFCDIYERMIAASVFCILTSEIILKHLEMLCCVV